MTENECRGEIEGVRTMSSTYQICKTTPRGRAGVIGFFTRGASQFLGMMNNINNLKQMFCRVFTRDNILLGLGLIATAIGATALQWAIGRFFSH